VERRPSADNIPARTLYQKDQGLRDCSFFLCPESAVDGLSLIPNPGTGAAPKEILMKLLEQLITASGTGSYRSADETSSTPCHHGQSTSAPSVMQTATGGIFSEGLRPQGGCCWQESKDTPVREVMSTKLSA